MPVTMAQNAEGKIVKRFWWYAEYVTPVDGIVDWLRDKRKTAIRDREEFLAFQKSCGRDDRVGAKFFGECASYALKLERSVTLMLPWFGGSDKGATPLRPLFWPVDLADALDEISGNLQLKFG